MAKPRSSKVLSHAAKRVREALAMNLKRLILQEYPGISSNAAFDRIEAATGMSSTTVQRLTKAEVGPSIDTLADLARHLGVSVAELVTAVSDESKKGTRDGKNWRSQTY